MKHYMDIQRLKVSFVDGFQKGDYIYIQEKIDGANFSIKYNAASDTVKAFSRKQELNEMNTLRGAWNFAQSLDKEKVAEVLGDNVILFGEWLVKHSVPYPAERYNQAYFYDAFDTATGEYLPQNMVINIVELLGLNYVPIFYIGDFISWDHIKSFIGKTELGGEYGEGVVVKNITRLNDPNNKLPFYVKLVGEKFAETKGHKEGKRLDPALVAEREMKLGAVENIVTRARVEKLLHKFVDENIIREDWDETDMGTIAKNLGKAVYADCVKEENDEVVRIGTEFGKLANSTAMRIAKVILAERTSV